jgi:hypothetical protein
MIKTNTVNHRLNILMQTISLSRYDLVVLLLTF